MLYPYIALIFAAAGFLQGLTGFGAALIAMPLLTLLMDLRTATPLSILTGLAITTFLSLQLRAHLEMAKILPLFIGSLPGIYLGILFLKFGDAHLLEALLGVILLAYSIVRLRWKPRPRQYHALWAYGAGFFTGAISSAFSAGGPPAIIYTTLTDWTKDQIKATLSGFFLASGIVTALGHAAHGLITRTVLEYFAVSGSAALLGVYCGTKWYARYNLHQYFRLIFMLLTILGIWLLFSGGRFFFR